MKLATCLLFALSLFGATYEVGPGKPYADPLNLPWTQLADGDTIKVYYSPEPYRRFMFVGWSNFTIECVRSEDGKRPIFDADGAIGTKKVSFMNWDRGLFRVNWSDSPPTRLLENVTIRGCEIRNVWRDKSPQTGVLNKGFAGEDRPNGQYQPWPDNGAGIQATWVKNIVIEDNYIHDSKIGVAIFGAGTNISSNCTIRNNQFENLGRDDSQSHVTYTECVGESIYNNHSKQPPGWSSVFKSRGICTKIYNNWIDGGDRVVDLVDSLLLRTTYPTSCPDIVANNYITRENAIDNDAYIHFGGDGKDLAGYRTQLYVLNNTIDTNRTLGNILVRTSAWTQTVVVLNNVFQWRRMARYGFLLGDWNEYRKTGPNGERSKISYGSNWFQKGSCPDPVSIYFLCGLVGPLDVTDLGKNIWSKSTGDEDKPPSNGPGWDSNYYPTATSPLLDGGVTPALPGVDWTFGGTRTIVGKAIDIGAFEAGTSDRPGIQTGGGFVITPPPTTTTTTTIPPASTTTSNNVPASTPPVTSFEQSIAALKGLVDKAATAKKVASDAAAAAAAAITEAKAAAARAEYDVTSAGEQYVQQIRKVLEDAGLK